MARLVKTVLPQSLSELPQIRFLEMSAAFTGLRDDGSKQEPSEHRGNLLKMTVFRTVSAQPRMAQTKTVTSNLRADLPLTVCARPHATSRWCEDLYQSESEKRYLLQLNVWSKFFRKNSSRNTLRQHPWRKQHTPGHRNRNASSQPACISHTQASDQTRSLHIAN